MMNDRDSFSGRPPRPMRVVREENGAAPRSFLRRNLFWLIAGALFLIAVLVFPRVLAFVELAARELRYFWWLVLLVALGVWLTFFFGKKR